MQFTSVRDFNGNGKGKPVFSMTAAQVFDEAEQRALINCSLTAKYT
jgi:hypothetical protein